MDIRCPACHDTFHNEQPYEYHMGFSNVGVLYCESCPNLLVFSSFDPTYISLIGNRHPWGLPGSDLQVIENHLRSCPCGGRFRFDASPRCPLCNWRIRQILRDKWHYVETGRVFDSEKENVWRATIGS